MTMNTKLKMLYYAAVAEFLQQHGTFVDLSNYPRYEWSEDREIEDDYDSSSTVYGWMDFEHGRGSCPVVSVDDSVLRERSLNQFQDTYTGNSDVAGLEMRATCACEKYVGMWLRWEGSLGDIMQGILDVKIDRDY